MKITKTEIFVLGDPMPSEPVDDRIAGLAFLRIHTDEGLTGLSEIFAVPPGVAKAVLDGPDSFFGRQLIGEDPITPERLWQKLYDSMIHGNRRGWAIICIGAVDVALWDLYGKALQRPVYQLLGAVRAIVIRSPMGLHASKQSPMAPSFRNGGIMRVCCANRSTGWSNCARMASAPSKWSRCIRHRLRLLN